MAPALGRSRAQGDRGPAPPLSRNGGEGGGAHPSWGGGGGRRYK